MFSFKVVADVCPDCGSRIGDHDACDTLRVDDYADGFFTRVDSEGFVAAPDGAGRLLMEFDPIISCRGCGLRLGDDELAWDNDEYW